MKYTPVFFFFLLFFSGNIQAQTDCKTIDLNKVPGKWIWESTAPSYQDQIPASQWKYCEPIRKELQRIMPIAIDGLHATNSIAFPKGKAFGYTQSPSTYECYLMLKDFECLKDYNKLQPEGETGCWIYFSINQLEGVNFPLPEQGTDIMFNESKIRITSIEVQTDASGNRIIYSQYRPEEIRKHCYFFSVRKGLPWRKLMNKELFTAYKTHHEKRVAEQIAKFTRLVNDDQKKYNSLSTAEKKEQSYWPGIIQKNKEYLQNYLLEKEKIYTWFASASKKNNFNDTAYVYEVNANQFLPEKLEADAGKGYHAWVDNLDFFDKAKLKDEPQCISLYLRRQDGDLPKKNFMDLFYNQFNLNVLRKMAGESPATLADINTLNNSLAVPKVDTKKNQLYTGTVGINFDNVPEGQFPDGWNGMKNISIQSFSNSKWLAMTKDGYWYPRQFNKEIKNNFSLSFDLMWNEDIAYNSGAFTVTFGDIDYDNAGERYRLDDNQEMFWSLYDGYAGNFNRVILWFDPYWNGGGTLTIYSYDNRESLKFNKRITLPDFYKDKNRHEVQIQRKGNGIIVTINGKPIADLPEMFLPAANYNLYTFSRYKGKNSDSPRDVFYLNDIRVQY